MSFRVAAETAVADATSCLSNNLSVKTYFQKR
jgi:hypothetical protein